MTAQTSSQAVHSTFTLEYHYPQAPARVFAAFAQPARQAPLVRRRQPRNPGVRDGFPRGRERTVSVPLQGRPPIAGSEIATKAPITTSCRTNGS